MAKEVYVLLRLHSGAAPKTSPPKARKHKMQSKMNTKTTKENKPAGSVNCPSGVNENKAATAQGRISPDSARNTKPKPLCLNEVSLVADALAGWQPMSRQEAEALWTRLEPINAGILNDLGGQVDGCWVVGEHGNEAVAVALMKDRRITAFEVQGDGPLLARLPKICYSDGPHSLVHFFRECLVNVENKLLCSDEGVGHLPERARRLFIHHATKPLPECRPVESYDNRRKDLSVHGAEAIAREAFRRAIKTARPLEKSGFADRWACLALANVMGEDADLALLTEEGAAHLLPLRDRNIHRTRNDLVPQAQAINERLEVERKATDNLAEKRKEEQKPYIDARRASFAAFQTALARAHRGAARNLKPFSQRLIKGLILAKVAGARLPIGTLIDSIGTALVARYGEALRFMQDIEVVVAGRVIPEMCTDEEIKSATGSFITCYPKGVVLAHPRIILQADVVAIDPRTIFHEFQHARQATASEEPIRHFHRAGSYETEIIEWKAKQAEADFTDEFGILY